MEEGQEGDEMLTTDAAAALIGVKRDTIYKWVKRGKLDYEKTGGTLRVSKRSVENMVKRGKATA